MHKVLAVIMVLCLTALNIAGCGSDGGSATTGNSAAASAVVVKNSSLPVGTNGTAYKTFLGASGGKAPYTWSIVTGTLPPGIVLTADGNLYGTPTTLGTFNVVYKVTDSGSPAQSDQKPLQINVSTLSFTPPTAGAGLYAEFCSFCHLDLGSSGQQHKDATLAQVKAAIAADTGGMGELGAGGLSPLSDAQLTSIIAAIAGTASTYITPSFTTTSLPVAVVGTPYSQTLTAKDGTLPYVWATMGGDPIPAGLSLNAATGVLSGTPTTAGTANVIFMLTDANPSTMVHQPITITVNAAAAGPDGAALYASKCASCHGALATSAKKGRTAAQIQAAIGGVGSMSSLSTLSAAQVQAIATALQ
jgi:large repetitive protein